MFDGRPHRSSSSPFLAARRRLFPSSPPSSPLVGRIEENDLRLPLWDDYPSQGPASYPVTPVPVCRQEPLPMDPFSLDGAHDISDAGIVRAWDDMGIPDQDAAFRARGYIGTFNNYNQWDFEYLTSPVFYSHVTYVIVGREVGASGTPHLQIYVYFKSPKTLSAARGLLYPVKNRQGWAKAKSEHSTHSQCDDYCRKDGNFTNFGIIPTGGRGNVHMASLYDETKNHITNGHIEAIDSRHLICHYANIQKLTLLFHSPPANLDSVCGWWFVGIPGSGKSSYARLGGDYYVKMRGKWWDGYKNQSDVILEDVDHQSMTKGFVQSLKLWSDRYVFPCEVKGATMSIRPRKLIVTSNYEMTDLGLTSVDLAALRRRFRVLRFSSICPLSEEERVAQGVFWGQFQEDLSFGPNAILPVYPIFNPGGN